MTEVCQNIGFGLGGRNDVPKLVFPETVTNLTGNCSRDFCSIFESGVFGGPTKNRPEKKSASASRNTAHSEPKWNCKHFGGEDGLKNVLSERLLTRARRRLDKGNRFACNPTMEFSREIDSQMSAKRTHLREN